mmetsp:Transcript_47285/g.125597  ORF Transcript_47285/g.125597 Transcript_47285/m.125597 type:complete len:234 (-) Transcript_47285:45-746(-)
MLLWSVRTWLHGFFRRCRVGLCKPAGSTRSLLVGGLLPGLGTLGRGMGRQDAHVDTATVALARVGWAALANGPVGKEFECLVHVHVAELVHRVRHVEQLRDARLVSDQPKLPGRDLTHARKRRPPICRARVPLQQSRRIQPPCLVERADDLGGCLRTHLVHPVAEEPFVDRKRFASELQDRAASSLEVFQVVADDAGREGVARHVPKDGGGELLLDALKLEGHDAHDLHRHGR